jgi:hypothetical protein
MLRRFLFAALISVLPLGYSAVRAQEMMHMKQGMQMSEADKGYMAAMQMMQQDMMKWK